MGVVGKVRCLMRYLPPLRVSLTRALAEPGFVYQRSQLMGRFLSEGWPYVSVIYSMVVIISGVLPCMQDRLRSPPLYSEEDRLQFSVYAQSSCLRCMYSEEDRHPWRCDIFGNV